MNKDFEALYAIAMSMANSCVKAKPMENRFEKLEEEYQELVEAFTAMKEMVPIRIHQGKPSFDGELYKENSEHLKDELADVLFVLLHIAHMEGETAFELLHRATTKMLKRMNDPSYIAKN